MHLQNHKKAVKSGHSCSLSKPGIRIQKQFNIGAPTFLSVQELSPATDRQEWRRAWRRLWLEWSLSKRDLLDMLGLTRPDFPV
jgi:hypothetical protein